MRPQRNDGNGNARCMTKRARAAHQLTLHVHHRTSHGGRTARPRRARTASHSDLTGDARAWKPLGYGLPRARCVRVSERRRRPWLRSGWDIDGDVMTEQRSSEDENETTGDGVERADRDSKTRIPVVM